MKTQPQSAAAHVPVQKPLSSSKGKHTPSKQPNMEKFPVYMKELAELEKFVAKNSIKYKECKRFLAPSKEAPCICGGLAEEHGIAFERSGPLRPPGTSHKSRAELEKERQIEGWRRSHAGAKTIAESLTENYGKIRFVNVRGKFEQDAQFIRASDSTSISVLVDLIVNHWKIFQIKSDTAGRETDTQNQVPQNDTDFIISILESQPTSLDDMQKVMIGHGCLKAVEATRGIVLSSGHSAGACGLVSEYLTITEEPGMNSRTCVGIGTWGLIADRDKIAKSHEPKYVSGRWGTENLDEKQDYVILIDNGLRNDHPQITSSTEEIRAKLEIQLYQDHFVVVGILVGGTLDILGPICTRLKAGIHILCVSGTGGLADAIADAEKLQPEKRSDSLMQSFLGLEKEKTTATAYINYINILLTNFDELISVFDANNMEYDIGHPLVSLYLKQKWTFNYEVTASPILTNLILSWPWYNSRDGQQTIMHVFERIDNDTKTKVLTEAFCKEKVELARFALSNPFLLHSWHLTFGGLLNSLYEYTKQMAERVAFFNSFTTDGSTLAKNVKFTIYLNGVSEPIDFTISEIKEDLSGQRIFVWSKSMASILQTYGEYLLKFPAEEILRWCIFTRKHELAMIVWEHTESPLISALGATYLYQTFLQNAKVSDQFKFNTACKNEFETMAIDMLAAIYNKREDYALKIIQDGRHQAWGNNSPATLALSAGDQHFIALPVVQMLINQVWVGKEKLQKEYVRIEDRCCGERSPRFKFICYYITYFPFLLVYSYFTLFMMDHEYVDNGDARIVDICLTIFVLSILMRRIVDALIGKFIVRRPSIGIRSLSAAWFWYWFSTVTVMMHLIGFIMRLDGYVVKDKDPSDPEITLPPAIGPLKTGDDSQHSIEGYILSEFQNVITGAKVLYCIAVFCFWFQLWELMVIVPKLGPYIYLIGRMLSSFFSFMVILVVLMAGYSVASQSLVYPQRDFKPHILLELFYYPYFQLYGELFLMETTGKGSVDGCVDGMVRNAAGIYCPNYSAAATIFLVIYLLLGIILLINLLIAVFSYQYDVCYEEFDTIWKYQTAMSVLVWDQHTSFPPPLSLITNMIQLVNIVRVVTARTGKYLINATIGHGKVEDDDTQGNENDWLLIYEQRCLKLRLHEQKMKDLEKSLKGKKRKPKKKTDFWVSESTPRKHSAVKEASILHQGLKSSKESRKPQSKKEQRESHTSSSAHSVLKLIKDAKKDASDYHKPKHHKDTDEP